MKKTTLIAGAMTIAMMTTAAVPTAVSAKSKKVPTPSKVSITSVKRVNNTKSTVTWKKLKKNASGYAVYVKKGSSSWKQTKKVGAKTTSITFNTGVNDKYQVKVRAYKNGKKVKKYYNKKTKKFVSKKAYKKLKKKNRTTKKVATVKWGKYSSVKTLNAVFNGQVKNVKASFDKNEDVNLSWNPVYSNLEDNYNVIDYDDNEHACIKKGNEYIYFIEYEIYRSDGGGYKLIGTTNEEKYIDKYYNPTAKKISYKVRPISFSYAGNWSKVATLNPEEITETITQTVPKKICTFCNEDVTELSDVDLQKNHSVYYCSICGRDKVASHNKADIEKHIQEKHSASTQATDNVMAEVKCDKAATKENGTKNISQEHRHNWKSVGTTTEKRVVGYKTEEEYHTFCFFEKKDIDDIYEGYFQWLEESEKSKNPDYNDVRYVKMKEHDRYDKEHYDGKWGRTYNDYVPVKKPIEKEVTVTKYQCDCGKIRTN